MRDDPCRNALGLHDVPGVRSGVPGLDRARRFDQRHAARSGRTKGNSPGHQRKRCNRSVANQIPTGGLTPNAWLGRRASKCRRPNRIRALNICSGSAAPRHSIRARKRSRGATAQLLKDAGVNFAVLGKEESCTGDPARRIGDEFLFQQRAQTNVETLTRRKVKKIVTPCPHCYNTLKNEYPQFGGQYEVQHHSTLLAELVGAGRLSNGSSNGEPITLHDPCYLARVNGEVDATRTVIGATSDAQFREMPRYGKKTFCCGAGGGRMWFEEAPSQRVSGLRAQEAFATGARTLATACPFCLNMMTDGMAGTQGGENVKVLDIAELLLSRRTRASR